MKSTITKLFIFLKSIFIEKYKDQLNVRKNIMTNFKSIKETLINFRDFNDFLEMWI